MIAYLDGKQVYETVLEYRGSDHGWKLDDFHERADNKGWTVSLFKILEGDCVGGFTTQSWDIKSHGYNWWVRDDNGFLFNLSCARLFPSQHSGSDIYCHSNWGPVFSGYGRIELGAWS
jgi:hypothetical protein